MVEQTRFKRACDRCHAVKERCRWTDGGDKCERCQRLDSICQTQRPLKPRGRKSRYTLSVARTSVVIPILPQSKKPLPALSKGSDVTPVDSSVTSSGLLKLPRTLSVFVDLNDRELQILDGIPVGRTRIDQYLVAPSFQECHIETFTSQLGKALPFLRDAILASSALIAHEHQAGPAQLDRMIGYRRAASAISSLRSLGSFEPGSISTVLSFGILAVCFADLISGRCLEICRHCLHLVKPLYDSFVPLDPDSISFMGSLIASELDECLFYCKVPTMRYRVEGSVPKVDRFLGISTPLLPYMYDIAVVSNILHYETGPNRRQIMKILDDLEEEVSQWKPELPKSYKATNPQADIISILTQANVTRWSILLIAHRLRHPYGTETAKAGAISKNILKDLGWAVQSTRRSFPGANRAFLVACFELTGPGERKSCLEKAQHFVKHSKQVQRNVRAMLTEAWTILDTKHQLYWHDLCTSFQQ